MNSEWLECLKIKHLAIFWLKQNRSDFMSIVLATGNSMINDAISKKVNEVVVVNYLEELKGIKKLHPKVKAVILSSYISSAFEGDFKKQHASFKETLINLKNDNIRVIYLTDTQSPFEFLEFLIQLGMYDVIVSEEGELELNDILTLLEKPNNSEKGLKIMGNIKEQIANSIGEQNGDLTTLDTKPISFQSEAKKSPFQKSARKEKGSSKESQPLLGKSNIRKRIEDAKAASISEGNEKVFAFWASTSNLGKRTLSQSFALQLAQKQYKVLYVELDYIKPAFATTTGLSSRTKNFYQLCLSQENFELEKFIASKHDVELKGKKGFQKVIEKIPDNFHFLALPVGFKTELFPKIGEGFVPNLIKAFNDSEYDAVVLNLPNELDDVFTYPVMLEVDKVFHVLSDNIVRIEEYREVKQFLQETPLNLNKWETIFNLVGEGISQEALDSLIGEKSAAAIPMDTMRSLHEMDLQIGSPSINEYLDEIVSSFGFVNMAENRKKKRLLGLF